jgi:hypothetical protein
MKCDGEDEKEEEKREDKSLKNGDRLRSDTIEVLKINEVR